ncbi:zinc finger protein ZAT9 [Cajanus cajan]|uniref:zinc finger protein ZAT9 n=1 Tax=Cajanus cajan TaxID=3821 RepID=UPI00098DD043|nr:zinc finger protein ZAT9 [Cajanus cajan]
MEKNNSKVCKICDKCFSNGKAMGGHMRSHFAKLPIPPKPETKNQALDNSAELTYRPNQSASSQTSQSQKKPAQNFRSLKRSLFSFSTNTNRENEFRPYPKNPTRKRSKCHRKFIAAIEMKADSEQVTPKPDSLFAEEAARSLLMLSKDKWPESKEIKNQEVKEIRAKDKEDGRDDLLAQIPSQANFNLIRVLVGKKQTIRKKWPESKEIKNQEVKEIRAKDKEDGRDDLLAQIPSQANFKCDKCGKIFQSHQALGGHKANHKKNENTWQGGDPDNDGTSKKSDDVGEKVFECPYCSKVFKSARALGGHKKVHFSYNKANAQSSANQFGRKLVVDLNFPAPIED